MQILIVEIHVAARSVHLFFYSSVIICSCPIPIDGAWRFYWNDCKQPRARWICRVFATFALLYPFSVFELKLSLRVVVYYWCIWVVHHLITLWVLSALLVSFFSFIIIVLLNKFFARYYSDALWLRLRLHHYICLKGHLSGSLEKSLQPNLSNGYNGGWPSAR